MKTRNVLTIITLLLVTLFQGACRSSRLYSEMPYKDCISVEEEPQRLPAPATSPAAANQPKDLPPIPNRQIIYSATLLINVENISESQKEAIHIARKNKGFLQTLNSEYLKIRVPAKVFHSVLTQLYALGSVIDKNISSQDISEKMIDFKVRLKNAEKMCIRLQELIKQGGKVEELLKIEKEIQRLTERIELIKGKIRYFTDKVSFSTIKIQFNSPRPQEIIEQTVPIAWVRHLGDTVSLDIHFSPRSSCWEVIDFEFPDGYMKFQSNTKTTYAMSANTNLIKLSKKENYDGGSLSFWSALIQKNLKQNKGFYIKGTDQLTIKNGIKASFIQTSKELDGKKYGYSIALAVDDDWVYLYESWGQYPNYIKDIPAIKQSIASMDPDNLIEYIFRNIF